MTGKQGPAPRATRRRRASRAHPTIGVTLVLLVGGCAVFSKSAPHPVLDGSWDMSATIDGEVYIGILSISPDGLVIWDGDLGQRNVCEAVPRQGGGGYVIPCPLRMDVIPNERDELVATVTETRRRESYRRRCLRQEEREARMVCVEWDVTPVEAVERIPRRIILLPTEGAVVRRGGGPGIAR